MARKALSSIFQAEQMENGFLPLSFIKIQRHHVTGPYGPNGAPLRRIVRSKNNFSNFELECGSKTDFLIFA